MPAITRTHTHTRALSCTEMEEGKGDTHHMRQLYEGLRVSLVWMLLAELISEGCG